MKRLVTGLVLAAWLGPAVVLGADAPPAPTFEVTVDGDRISVRAHAASLRAVLAAIASRAGLALRIHGTDDRPVTVSFEKVELAAAIDRVVRGDWVLAGDRLILFLGPARARGAAIRNVRALPGVGTMEGGIVDAPADPGTPITRGGASSALTPGAVRDVSPTTVETGASRGGRRPGLGRRSGSAMAGPEVIDPAEAQRLAREIEARSTQAPLADTPDVTASEAVLRQSLP